MSLSSVIVGLVKLRINSMSTAKVDVPHLQSKVNHIGNGESISKIIFSESILFLS